ncbi:MAG: hypothetical protein BWX78_01117 [Firmicutes bacterium ADurb.Bin099]|jgi:hypothetical protein|nr:MAG: hypothetical protein BWX78_01117 [Firmicutes bacterium ADurb.Bin099]
MWELFNNLFHELIKNYKNCVIDYYLIKDDTPHQGKRSHKDAVLFAMLKVRERYINTQLKTELKYISGRRTGQTILMPVMNGGVWHARVYMISAGTDM